MSCAAFTFLGMWVLYANESNTWSLRATFGLAICCLFWACFLAWKDKEKEVEILKAQIRDLKTSTAIQISELNQEANDGIPRLGMRGISLFKGTPWSRDDEMAEVEFRLCLLSGRPATSITIEPVYSKNSSYSVHFATLSFLKGTEEYAIAFEVKNRGESVSRRPDGYGKWHLGHFLWDSRIEGGVETSPIIVNFKDGTDLIQQRFRLTFDFNTRQIGFIDEPYFV
jgi:hypothetical protein